MKITYCNIHIKQIKHLRFSRINLVTKLDKII